LRSDEAASVLLQRQAAGDCEQEFVAIHFSASANSRKTIDWTWRCWPCSCCGLRCGGSAESIFLIIFFEKKSAAAVELVVAKFHSGVV
jgi:hypothetical protein